MAITTFKTTRIFFSSKLKYSLVFILEILLLVTIVFGKDVHVFHEIGAIAERF